MVWKLAESTTLKLWLRESLLLLLLFIYLKARGTFEFTEDLSLGL
jgi:hypothetical protein